MSTNRFGQSETWHMDLFFFTVGSGIATRVCDAGRYETAWRTTGLSSETTVKVDVSAGEVIRICSSDDGTPTESPSLIHV